MGSMDNNTTAPHQLPGFHRLPLRVREGTTHTSTHAHGKANSTCGNPSATSTKDATRFKPLPESLHLLSSGNARIRSPTESSMSTLSSVPDSATTCSLSTVASPLSSSYTSDLQDLFNGSRPASRVRHRHQPSNTTCSTFVNDDDYVPVIAEYPDISTKLGNYQPSVDEVRPQSREDEETLLLR